MKIVRFIYVRGLAWSFLIGICLCGTSVHAYTETITYQYDDIDRLKVAETGQGVKQTFNFDEVHNRTSSTRANAPGNAPVANNDNYTVALNTPKQVTGSGVLANDTNPLANNLTIISSTNPSHGSLSINNSSGAFTYTPYSNYIGTDSFTYQVTNGIKSNYGIVTFTVGSPPVAKNDSYSVQQNIFYNLLVLSNDGDSNNSGLNIDSVDYHGDSTVYILGSVIKYRSLISLIGEETFTYTLIDGRGAKSTAHVTVNVSDRNFAPTVLNETVWVTKGKTVTIPVLANDTDVDNDELSIASISHSGSGSASHNGTSIIFSASSSSTATQTINYIVSDGTGSASGRVTVYIVSNNSPTARNDSYTIIEDIATTFDVLSNDTDPNGDPLVIYYTSNPAHGRVSIIGDQLYYTPDRNYSGGDSFTYRIKDTQGLTNQATVTITIENDEVNDPPIAVNDEAKTKNTESVIINVLANDSDIDRDTIRVQSYTQPSSGAVTRSGNNLKYTPAAGFSGNVTFTYVISDGNGLTDSATVTVRKKINIVPILMLLLNDEEENGQ